MPRRFQIRNFYSLVRLVFEQEVFKATIGISVFGSETRIT